MGIQSTSPATVFVSLASTRRSTTRPVGQRPANGGRAARRREPALQNLCGARRSRVGPKPMIAMAASWRAARRQRVTWQVSLSAMGWRWRPTVMCSNRPMRASTMPACGRGRSNGLPIGADATGAAASRQVHPAVSIASWHGFSGSWGVDTRKRFALYRPLFGVSLRQLTVLDVYPKSDFRGRSSLWTR